MREKTYNASIGFSVDIEIFNCGDNIDAVATRISWLQDEISKIIPTDMECSMSDPEIEIFGEYD